ncbi:hypothetical protein EYF80_063571 [Liparis tanakae]|nr:hypothetical protein EYF80_063571 [Liparis tanakae]
MLEVIT